MIIKYFQDNQLFKLSATIDLLMFKIFFIQVEI